MMLLFSYFLGQYVYIEASDMKAGERFLLLTPDLSVFKDPPYMVTFWYHAYGHDIGALNVYEFDGFAQKGPVWSQATSTETGETITDTIIDTFTDTITDILTDAIKDTSRDTIAKYLPYPASSCMLPIE